MSSLAHKDVRPTSAHGQRRFLDNVGSIRLFLLKKVYINKNKEARAVVALPPPKKDGLFEVMAWVPDSLERRRRRQQSL
jgi:hypothetical protein